MRVGRSLSIIATLALIAMGGYYQLRGHQRTVLTDPAAPGRHGGRHGSGHSHRAIPVQAARVQRGTLDIWVDALGTVTASDTVKVKPRVDGPLVRVVFREGQQVRAGDLLAEIDPRPFQIALDQAQGQLVRDQAQLTGAQIDLKRYRGLLEQHSVSRQQVDTQLALVNQLEGQVQADRAQVAAAHLQLGFTRISAPIDGRLGLRLVDVGNIVRTTDSSGLVVITRTQPIAVLFSVPADSVRALLREQSDAALEVQALDRDGKTLLARGALTSIDNQIDLTTGTIKLKAMFANQDQVLFPNQFVNVRLKTATLKDALQAPTAALQRGTSGVFVYLVQANHTVALRTVILGATIGDNAVIEQGLQPGDQVVIDGTDKLREGSKVEVVIPGQPATSVSPQSEKHHGRHHHASETERQ